MKLRAENKDVFIPTGDKVIPSLKRTTHMAIGAHQDDLEIFGFHGIKECFNNQEKWFTGVVVTNGAGSSRTGNYKEYTDEEMQLVRKQEQRKAAVVGEYSAMIQLGYSSSEVKDSANSEIVNDLTTLIAEAAPTIIYLHNLADKHTTHVATAVRSITALRKLPEYLRPEKVYGCEVWRDLDWLSDDDKIALSTSGYPSLATSLLGVFDSQISGGKRYDLATLGRRKANATFHNSHKGDRDTSITFAMDLTPLITNPEIEISEFITGFIERTKNEITATISQIS